MRIIRVSAKELLGEEHVVLSPDIYRAYVGKRQNKQKNSEEVH